MGRVRMKPWAPACSHPLFCCLELGTACAGRSEGARRARHPARGCRSHHVEAAHSVDFARMLGRDVQWQGQGLGVTTRCGERQGWRARGGAFQRSAVCMEHAGKECGQAFTNQHDGQVQRSANRASHHPNACQRPATRQQLGPCASNCRGGRGGWRVRASLSDAPHRAALSPESSPPY